MLFCGRGLSEGICRAGVDSARQIAVECLHVHSHVGYGLRTIYHHQSARVIFRRHRRVAVELGCKPSRLSGEQFPPVATPLRGESAERRSL